MIDAPSTPGLRAGAAGDRVPAPARVRVATERRESLSAKPDDAWPGVRLSFDNSHGVH